MGHALQSSLLPASLTSRTQSSSFMTNRMKETSTFFDIWAGGAGSQGHSDDDAQRQRLLPPSVQKQRLMEKCENRLETPQLPISRTGEAPRSGESSFP